MSMIRPDVKAWFIRWREALVAAVIALLAGLGAASSFGITRWLMLALASAALVGVVLGVQQGRFRKRQQAPGVVQLVEGKLIYMGPLTGGSVDLEDVQSVVFDPHGIPAGHWVIGSSEGVLAIPAGAKGQDELFDAFSVLPRADMRRFSQAQNATGVARQVWARNPERPTMIH